MAPLEDEADELGISFLNVPELEESSVNLAYQLVCFVESKHHHTI